MLVILAGRSFQTLITLCQISWKLSWISNDVGSQRWVESRWSVRALRPVYSDTTQLDWPNSHWLAVRCSTGSVALPNVGDSWVASVRVSIATQLNSTRCRVELSCVAINGRLDVFFAPRVVFTQFIADRVTPQERLSTKQPVNRLTDRVSPTCVIPTTSSLF